jgi:hypothetical protein
MRVRTMAMAAALATLAPVLAHAHFKLIEPASWIVEDDRGDPQKMSPCGGAGNNPGTPTNAVTKVQGNSKLHLKIEETIYHPGHYRVALAINSRTELPQWPEVVTKPSENRGPLSVSAPIADKPQAPVIADGLFVHDKRPESCPPTGICKVPGFWETDIQIPNVNCKKCTLQVIQFMAEHAYNANGGFFYHHCAELEITANSKAPLDKRFPTWVGTK